jgi:hypothetical protein
MASWMSKRAWSYALLRVWQSSRSSQTVAITK